MSANESRVTLDDGKTTTLEVWGSGGPNILCVHGITSSRKGWERTASRFELANRVWAYDQRGHGDSANVHGPMTLDQSVRDLQTVAATIPGGVDYLIGHSWGGAVVLLGALALSVRAVVAIDPMVHQRPGTWYEDFVSEIKPAFELHGDERENAIVEYYRDLDPLEIQAKVHAMRNMSLAPIEALGRENRVDEGQWDLRERLVNYPVPLLMLLADPKESIVDQEDVAFIRQHGGPNITISVFEGEGHSLQRTAFDDYARTTERFLVAS